MILPLVAISALSAPAPQIVASPSLVGYPPAATVVLPNGVTSLASFVYSSPTGYRPLTLDLYLPPRSLPKPAAGFPLIVFIHGGGWLGGDARHCGPFVDFPDVLAKLAARGYVVASVTYRLSGEAAFPAPIQDVKTAIRWLRSRADAYAIDPARAATWGVSAGGHLAALAAVSGDVAALEPPQRESNAPALDGAANIQITAGVSDQVQGAAIWYGVYDFASLDAQAREAGLPASQYGPGAAQWRMLGCPTGDCQEAQVAAASPVTYVNASTPPFLLMAGDKDTTVPYQQTLEMADKLKAVGVATELTIFPNLNHSFVGETLEQTRATNLQALAATFAFFDKVLGATRNAEADGDVHPPTGGH